MRTTARVGILLSLMWASSALAADVYSIQADNLDTGSNIPRAAVTWPVPINKGYAELSAEQQRVVNGGCSQRAGQGHSSQAGAHRRAE